MEFEIVFCTDGILRFKFGNKPLIPVEFIQKESNYPEDVEFWFKYWNNLVIFEEGLTLSQFLMCLEPWSYFWSVLTQKDIQAFIDESKKPCLVDNQLISWISLSYYNEFSLDIKYEQLSNETMNLDQSSNFSSKGFLTGLWNVQASYRLTGYKEGIMAHHCIEAYSMNTIGNLPLILVDEQIVLIEDFLAKRILGNNYQMFSNNAYGIRNTGHSEDLYKSHYLLGKKNHCLHEVIKGFFEWFPSNPSSRTQYVEKNVAKETEKSNIVSLFNNSQPLNTLDCLETSQYFWQQMSDKAKKNNHVIVKIGEIKKATPPENRIFSYIVEHADLSTS